MDDGQAKNPAKDQVKGQVKGARQERLKQALRDNLKRRKAQARQRRDSETPPSNLHEAALAKDAREGDE